MTKELILLSLYILLLTYLLVMRKTRLLKLALLAFGIGLVWTLLVRQEYDYNTGNITILSINLYTLLGWSLGLWIGYILYMAALRFVRASTWWQRLLLFNVSYLPLLIVVEAVAYHSFNVVNVATASFNGLPLCDCLHAPFWMKIAYLSMGSIYFLLTLTIKTKRSTTILDSEPAAILS